MPVPEQLLRRFGVAAACAVAVLCAIIWSASRYVSWGGVFLSGVLIVLSAIRPSCFAVPYRFYRRARDVAFRVVMWPIAALFFALYILPLSGIRRVFGSVGEKNPPSNTSPNDGHWSRSFDPQLKMP